MAAGDPVRGSLFVYAPNKIGSIIFSCFYAASAIGHIWQCWRYKAWSLIWLHPLCAVLFTVGYAMRTYAAFDHYIYTGTPALIIFIVSQVLIYVCPPLLELSNYKILGRIFYYIPHQAPIRPGIVMSTFGALMALVEALNALGVALAANPSSSEGQQGLGKDLVMAALSLQIAVIVIFICLAGIFHWRCSKYRSRAIFVPLRTLYTSMALIFIRCIYRLVEHTGNATVHLKDFESLKQSSPILRFEWYFFIFESTLMLINSLIWNVWHPARYLPLNLHVHLGRDGVEIAGEEEIDERQLIAKAGHVLTFGILFRRKNEHRAF